MWGEGAEEGRQYQLLKLKLAQVQRGEREERRGEGRGERRVWCCCTLCDSCNFSSFSSTSPVFAIRPRSEAEGDAPSRVGL